MTALLLWLTACAPPGSPPPTEPAEDPVPWNLVIVVSDALRAPQLPLHGYPRDTTPTLSALAEESLVFDHAFAAFPGTPQSMSQLLTGQLHPPLLMGAKWFANPLRRVTDETPVLPRLLDQAGYRTGLVSSHYWWTDDSRLLPLLDHHHIVESEASYAPFEELIPPVEAFLDDAADEPFFLLVHSMDTHGPWNDLDADLDQPDWPEAYSRLDTDVRRTDRGLQALIDRLKARGLWERTVFVFTSDHGDEFGELGPEPWNRNHGIQVRRPLAHVPLVVRLPGGEAAGRYGAPVSLTDLTPTLTSLLAPKVEWTPTDGRDLHRAWLGGQQGDPNEAVLGHSWWFRAAYLPERELIFDRWTGEGQWYNVRADTHNYPRLTPSDAPSSDVLQQLQTSLDRSRARWRDAEPIPQTAPLSVAVVPMRPATTPAPLTFQDRPDDGLWSHPGTALTHHPGESVPPLSLQWDWAPGFYDVAFVVDDIDGVRADALELTLNGVRIQAVPGPSDPTRLVLRDVRLETSNALTVHPRPETGLRLTSLEVRPVGAPEPVQDPLLQQKLTELGYVEPD